MDRLVRDLAKWDRALRRLQRAHPERWHVPGWSDDEVRDAITLRLVELVHSGSDVDDDLTAAKQYVAELRRTFRVRSTPMDMRGAEISRRSPSVEDDLLDRETDACRAVAGARAEARLTRPQRRWLAAMREAASRGEFFASSDDLNLSAAARSLGKHRSSAQRAYEELRARFAREKQRIE